MIAIYNGMDGQWVGVGKIQLENTILGELKFRGGSIAIPKQLGLSKFG